MKVAIIIIRTLVGLVFALFGLAVVFGLMKAPPPPPGLPGEFMKLMFVDSHYMYAVKCFEAVGGLLLLTGRFAPLGLTLIGPVVVNILFFDFLIDGSSKAEGAGIVLAALALFLLWAYRKAFKGLLTRGT